MAEETLKAVFEDYSRFDEHKLHLSPWMARERHNKSVAKALGVKNLFGLIVFAGPPMSLDQVAESLVQTGLSPKGKAKKYAMALIQETFLGEGYRMDKSGIDPVTGKKLYRMAPCG